MSDAAEAEASAEANAEASAAMDEAAALRADTDILCASILSNLGAAVPRRTTVTPSMDAAIAMLDAVAAEDAEKERGRRFLKVGQSKSFRDMRDEVVRRQEELKCALTAKLGDAAITADFYLHASSNEDEAMQRTVNEYVLLTLLAPFFLEVAPGVHRVPERGVFVSEGVLMAMRPNAAWDMGVLDAVVRATFPNVHFSARPGEFFTQNGRTYALNQAIGEDPAAFYRRMCVAEGCAPLDARAIAAMVVRIVLCPSSHHLLADVVDEKEADIKRMKRDMSSIFAAMKQHGILDDCYPFIMQQYPVKRPRSQRPRSQQAQYCA